MLRGAAYYLIAQFHLG